MPGKSHETDVAILVVLGLAAAVVILAAIALGYIGRESAGGPPIPSSYSRNTRGAAVGYELFSRLGYPVVRHEAPLFEDALEACTALFVLSPVYDLEDGETMGLRNWLRRGGLLVCTPDVYRRLRGEACSFGAGSVCCQTEPIRRRFEDDAPSRRGGTIIPPQDRDLPLAADALTVHLASADTLEEALPVAPPESSEDEILAENVAEAFTPLLRDEQGMRVGVRGEGPGRIVVLADTSFLENGRLGRADNSIVAVNLAHYVHRGARGGCIGFDEYHFGFGGRPTGGGTLKTMLFRTAPGWSVLMLTAAGIGLLFYKGRRFGTRRAPARPRRRSKLEYVHEVGATYRAAGADRLAFRIVYQWFRRRAALRFNMSPDAASPEIAAAAERYAGIGDGRYRSLMAACERAVTGPRRLGLRRTALLKELANMEREIFDGHSARQ